MTALELSVDQVEAVDGGAFLITMPGEDDPTCLENWPECVNGEYDPRCCRFPKSCSVNEVPPSVLVALNQPCPTCKGMRSTSPGFGYSGDPCPDCGGSGRLVFDLKTPCNECGWMPHQHHTDWDADTCPMCFCSACEDGIVARRVWLDPEWGILPITYEGEGDEWDAEGCGSPHVMIFTGMSAGVSTRRLILCDGANDPDTVVTDDVGDAPPAARPGDYVARAVKETE